MVRSLEMLDSSESLFAAEEALISNLSIEKRAPAPVFIVGAPRTGSTLLYQALANAFGLPYISNFTDKYFSEIPIIGLAIQKSIRVDITWTSEFGKTLGGFQPSEGSGVLSGWFGGGHPSQAVSTRILEGREKNFLGTLAAVETLYDDRPLLIKNPWNCFRIPYLAQVLPHARFIWIRRDIAIAAASDLEARYLTKGSAHAWNSATPSNVEELRLLSPPAQVVENQYEFNQAIEHDLETYAEGRSLHVWYEDFLRFPERVLVSISQKTGLDFVPNRKGGSLSGPRDHRVSEEEKAAIREYVASNRGRFSAYSYCMKDSQGGGVS
jgi:hypothetical protein